MHFALESNDRTGTDGNELEWLGLVITNGDEGLCSPIGQPSRYSVELPGSTGRFTSGRYLIDGIALQ